MTQRPIRICGSYYLNGRPLTYGLAERLPDCEITGEFPNRAAEMLAAGECDVALVPSVELFFHPEYTIVSNACVGCRGAVSSVFLFSRVPIEQIRTVGLDEKSRTSVALTRLMLSKHCPTPPEYSPLTAGTTLRDLDADAALLIGDRCLVEPDGHDFRYQWDLGHDWFETTGLPFVFALWAGRNDAALEPVATALAAARDRGVADSDQIADHEAPLVGLPAERCRQYLREHLHYTLGEEEKKGLRLFYDEAAQQELVPPGWELTMLGEKK